MKSTDSSILYKSWKKGECSRNLSHSPFYPITLLLNFDCFNFWIVNFFYCFGQNADIVCIYSLTTYCDFVMPNESVRRVSKPTCLTRNRCSFIECVIYMFRMVFFLYFEFERTVKNQFTLTVMSMHLLWSHDPQQAKNDKIIVTVPMTMASASALRSAYWGNRVA